MSRFDFKSQNSTEDIYREGSPLIDRRVHLCSKTFVLGVILCECQAEEAPAVEMNPCSAPEIWSNSSSVSNCPVAVDTLLLAFSCHDLLAIVVLKDCKFFSRDLLTSSYKVGHKFTLFIMLTSGKLDVEV